MIYFSRCLLVIALHCQISGVSQAVDFLCRDSKCSSPFSNGILITDLQSVKETLEKGTQVSICGRSVTSGTSLLRIISNRVYYFVDASFITETGKPDLNRLKRFSIDLTRIKSHWLSPVPSHQGDMTSDRKIARQSLSTNHPALNAAKSKSSEVRELTVSQNSQEAVNSRSKIALLQATADVSETVTMMPVTGSSGVVIPQSSSVSETTDNLTGARLSEVSNPHLLKASSAKPAIIHNNIHDPNSPFSKTQPLSQSNETAAINVTFFLPEETAGTLSDGIPTDSTRTLVSSSIPPAELSLESSIPKEKRRTAFDGQTNEKRSDFADPILTSTSSQANLLSSSTRNVQDTNEFPQRLSLFVTDSSIKKPSATSGVTSSTSATVVGYVENSPFSQPEDSALPLTATAVSEKAPKIFNPGPQEFFIPSRTHDHSVSADFESEKYSAADASSSSVEVSNVSTSEDGLSLGRLLADSENVAVIGDQESNYSGTTEVCCQHTGLGVRPNGVSCQEQNDLSTPDELDNVSAFQECPNLSSPVNSPQSPSILSPVPESVYSGTEIGYHSRVPIGISSPRDELSASVDTKVSKLRKDVCYFIPFSSFDVDETCLAEYAKLSDFIKGDQVGAKSSEVPETAYPRSPSDRLMSAMENLAGRHSSSKCEITDTNPELSRTTSELKFNSRRANLQILSLSCSQALFTMIDCLSLSANTTVHLHILSMSIRSTLSRFVIRVLHYFVFISVMIVDLIPTYIRSSMDHLYDGNSSSFIFVICWILVITHLFFIWSVWKLFLILSHWFGFCFLSVVPGHLMIEECLLQLGDGLSDQEDTNTYLSYRTAQITLKLQRIEQETSEQSDKFLAQLNKSDSELRNLQSELTDSQRSCFDIEEKYKRMLLQSNEKVTDMEVKLATLEDEKTELEASWKVKLNNLINSHQKAMEDCKTDREELYSQAVSYYDRMKSLQSEIDKLHEVCQKAEEKLSSTEAELSTLQTLFTTLKSFDVAIEQLHTHESKLLDSREGHAEPVTDNSVKSEDTVNSNLNISDGGTSMSELRSYLAQFLDAGRLQTELNMIKTRVKSEEAKASCERELREQLEKKVETLDREVADTKHRYQDLLEEKSSLQTKLDVLSNYFKERELELQRDLGKHLMVGSESSEALVAVRRRNRELEAELKSVRDQLTVTRRDLAETERIGRRQMAELERRSHENWLAARAADHQLREIRTENANLRRSLTGISNSAVASHSQNPAINQPTRIIPRPCLFSGVTSAPSGFDVRSLSGQSVTSSASVSCRDNSVSFPFLPPTILGLPRATPATNSHIPPSFVPEFIPPHLRFPSGFASPPFVSHLNRDVSLTNRSPPSSSDGRM